MRDSDGGRESRPLFRFPEPGTTVDDMDARLGRSLALVVVIALVGGVTLRHRAQQLAERGVSRPARGDSLVASGPEGENGDSALAVALAERAYRADDSVLGVPPRGIHVLAFVRDSGGALITLVPADLALGRGGDKLIRVPPGGVVEVMRRSP